MKPFNRPVFFVPATGTLLPVLIDEATLDPDGHYVGRYSKERLDKITLRYPGATVGDLDAFIEKRDSMMRTQPTETTAEVFEDALSVLPPLDFQRNCLGTSFKCVERLSGRITAIYAELQGRYFFFNDLDTTTHLEIIAKVRASLSEVSA
jgi:hypothetical protein